MFTIKRRINFFDCDPAGILFYAKLFEINHSTYEEMIESFNLKNDYWDSETFVVPIIKTDGEYLKPVKAEDQISINLSVTLLKENSFELTYEWFNNGGEIVAKARTVHIFLDKESWSKINIPEDIRAVLQSHRRDYNI
ncbi:MAG: acyl-CoA thioesterase [Ignavibacteria bacterium]|nr:acyl-CoA thioesterase [Ignavibacteria bacterium]MBT8383727.1 acyl-CoA thioesterase [Ignavibacteria bacterium]MBT8391906.1 acyl-CoA thioesterase [Ignavibacteria bacterium]NNJ53314.1 acyl-CoA thioesterase [Ignavibacteriaceae bacterium]NNL22252.1 acyl-CoA thioesterase [Ignavibacteriaceae bacterium]